MMRVQLASLTILAVFLSAECLFVGDNCVGEEERAGKCMLLKECQALNDEVKQLGSPIPSGLMKKLQGLSCGFQDAEPLVCCGSPTTETTDHKTPKQLNGAPNILNHKNIKLLPTKCGEIDDIKLIRGKYARLFEMPWMVLIAYESAGGVKLRCGGTLISERYVLTAAHCVTSLVTGMSLSKVVLGEYDLSKDPDCDMLADDLYECMPPVKNVTIEKVIPHPGYNRKSRFDDIALIKLAESANFPLYGMPICLPTSEELLNQDLNNETGVVTGWAATKSNILLFKTLSTVSNEECQNIFKSSATISNRQMCASYKEKEEICAGDSGGPIVYRGRKDNEYVYVQRGVLSYGPKSCNSELPEVFTRVSHYMDWILDNISG